MRQRAARAWEWANCSLADDWHYNADFDRFFWGLTLCIYTVFTAKLAPQLSRAENLENLGIYLGVIGMAVITIRFPAACRRHTPLLRMALLVYMYNMPILTSVDAMHAISPAPSKVAYLAGVVDTISLWVSTSHAFVAWTMMATRPPLYVALPAQVFVLWRLTAAGFCRAPILQHHIMQARTERAHFALAHLPSAFGLSPPHMMVPSTPDGRCWALLLFYSVVFSLLLPLLLLVPLRQQADSGGSGGSARRRGLAARSSQCIQACLQALLWPTAADVPLATWAALLVRWLLLLALLWMGCCLLADPS